MLLIDWNWCLTLFFLSLLLCIAIFVVNSGLDHQRTLLGSDWSSIDKNGTGCIALDAKVAETLSQRRSPSFTHGFFYNHLQLLSKVRPFNFDWSAEWI